MNLQGIQHALFAAIAEGRFELISPLASEYKLQVKQHLTLGGTQGAALTVGELVKPLTRALHLLCIIRAHQSARFQKLAGDTFYQPSLPIGKGRNLDIDG